MINLTLGTVLNIQTKKKTLGSESRKQSFKNLLEMVLAETVYQDQAQS